MRQRVAIALATICRPEFIIADEPTTALDVVVQKEVLALMREIQREMRSSILFVTHDMSVHANMADRLGIMYAGRLVEEAPTADIFARPLHPYTQHLIQSLPRIGDATHAQGPERRAAQPRRAAARVPVPSALPGRDGPMPHPAAGADHAAARPPGRMLRRGARGPAGLQSPPRPYRHEWRSAFRRECHPQLRTWRAVRARPFQRRARMSASRFPTANPRYSPSSASPAAASRRWPK